MFANPEVSAFIDRLIGGQPPHGGAPPPAPSYRGVLARSLLGDVTRPMLRGNFSPPAIEAPRHPIAAPLQSVGVNRGVGSQETQQEGNRPSGIGTGASGLAAGIEKIGTGISNALDNAAAADELAALKSSFPKFGGGVAEAGGTDGNLPAFARRPGVEAGTPAIGPPGDYLAKVAAIENPSGNPYATSSTGATGQFQFVPSTWRQFGAGGNIHDPMAQNAAMTRFTHANYIALENGLGRPPTDGELYLAHQQGAEGALKLLRNPSVPAGQLVGEQAISVNGGNPNAPASAFVGKWTGRFGDAQSYADKIQDQRQDAAQRPVIPNPALRPQGMLVAPPSAPVSPLALALSGGQMPPIDPNFGAANGLFG